MREKFYFSGISPLSTTKKPIDNTLFNLCKSSRNFFTRSYEPETAIISIHFSCVGIYRTYASNLTWAVLSDQDEWNNPTRPGLVSYVPYHFDAAGNQINNNSALGYNFTANTLDTYIDALLQPDGKHPLQSGVSGLLMVVPFFKDKAPLDTKSYLAMTLKGGIPAHQSTERWLDKVVEDFDVDEDLTYGDNFVYGIEEFLYLDSGMAPYTPPARLTLPVLDNQHKGGIDVDGLEVTVEYEWVTGVLGVDGVNQREDYEIIYTYSDTGAQSSVEFVSGDDTFWKKESLSPAIPGYEIPILLGVAALSALSLVFIIMKKKRM